MLLHVTNGDSAAATLRRTGLGGTVLPWRDTLHEGPVPAVSRPDLLRKRAAFLSECGWGDAAALARDLEGRDRTLIDAFRAGAQVVLWFEHDLYDQLQLLDVLTLAHEAGATSELIVVGSFPGRPSFSGLGELSSGELETLWPMRRPADMKALETAAEVWAAFREPEPMSLASWATERDTTDLPFLAGALVRLLEELPACGDGLSGTERRALEAIAGGARTAPDAFAAAQRHEDAPFLGDTWFFRALTTLGSRTNRLVETDGGDPLPAPPPLGDHAAFVTLRLRLTQAGEQVLAGDADRVGLLGVDRWIGGTHVTPTSTWRWDPARRAPARRT